MPVYFDEKTKTWFCKFYYTDYTGQKKQKKKRGSKLQREAKKWERAFLEKQQGSPDMTSRPCMTFIQRICRIGSGPGTIRSKGHVFERHILPYFGSRPVNAITPADIRAWQDKIMVLCLQPEGRAKALPLRYTI